MAHPGFPIGGVSFGSQGVFEVVALGGWAKLDCVFTGAYLLEAQGRLHDRGALGHRGKLF